MALPLGSMERLDLHKLRLPRLFYRSKEAPLGASLPVGH
jgi:hypothetical protein